MMLGAGITGISIAVAVTVAATLAIQIRADVKNSGAFQVRENQLIELNRKNRENFQNSSTRAKKLEKRMARAEETAARERMRAESLESAALAAREQVTEECPAKCFRFSWQPE